MDIPRVFEERGRERERERERERSRDGGKAGDKIEIEEMLEVHG